MNYQELLKQPDKAVQFGHGGFEFSEATWAALADEAYLRTCETESPNSPAFERLYDFIEETLVEILEAAVTAYAHNVPVEQIRFDEQYH